MRKRPTSPEAAESATVATSNHRARTQAQKPTVVEHLFANPQAFSDDEIKVWVRASQDPHSEEFVRDLTDSFERSPMGAAFVELIGAREQALLAPGQHFILIRAEDRLNLQWGLYRIAPLKPSFEFRGVQFHVIGSFQDYKGLPVGDGRQLVTAARRALKTTKGADWFGGIADFAARFLRRPRGWTPVLH